MSSVPPLEVLVPRADAAHALHIPEYGDPHRHALRPTWADVQIRAALRQAQDRPQVPEATLSGVEGRPAAEQAGYQRKKRYGSSHSSGWSR